MTTNAPFRAGSAARIFTPGLFRPQIMLDTPNDGGVDDDAAAKAAADKAAAEKAAADKAVADEAARQAEADKSLTEEQKQNRELLREVMDKKNKLKDTTAALEAAKAEAKRWEGIDLDQVKQLLADKANAEKADLEKRGEFTRLTEMMAEAHKKEKTELEAQLQASQGQISGLAKTVDELTIGQSFTASEFVTGDLVLTPSKARQLYAGHFELKDGVVVGYNKPAGQAGRTMWVGADSKPLSFDEAFKRIIDADPEKERLIKDKRKPGSGSNSQQQLADRRKEAEGEGLYGAARIQAALKNRQKN